MTSGCSFEKFNGAREPILPSHGNGSPGPTSIGTGRGARTSGCLEIPRLGTTFPDCPGRPSDDTSWFVLMRRQMIQTYAPIGNDERPGKRTFFLLGDKGNWPNGKMGYARPATVACITAKSFTFITLSPRPKEGRTPSQTSRWSTCTAISKHTRAAE